MAKHLKKIPVRRPQKSKGGMGMDVMPGDQDMLPMHRPSFNVHAKQMPEIEDWEVGKRYRLEVLVEMTARRQDKFSDNAELELVAYKAEEKKSYEDMEDDEFAEEHDRQMEKHSSRK